MNSSYFALSPNALLSPLDSSSMRGHWPETLTWEANVSQWRIILLLPENDTRLVAVLKVSVLKIYFTQAFGSAKVYFDIGNARLYKVNIAPLPLTEGDDLQRAVNLQIEEKLRRLAPDLHTHFNSGRP